MEANFDKMLDILTALTTKVEEIATMSVVHATIGPVLLPNNTFEPMETEKDVEQFEERIHNPVFVAELVRFLLNFLMYFN